MSLKPIDPQRSFYHTSYLCGELFGARDRFSQRLIRLRRNRLFRERILPKLLMLRPKLESLYCEGNGRPAVDPVMLAGVTLLRRVFFEQFEVVEGKLQPTRKRPARAVQNPHDPDAHYADKGKKQRRLKTRWRVWLRRLKDSRTTMRSSPRRCMRMLSL